MVLDHFNTPLQLKLDVIPETKVPSDTCCHPSIMPLDGQCNMLMRLHYHQRPPYFRLRQL